LAQRDTSDAGKHGIPANSEVILQFTYRSVRHHRRRSTRRRRTRQVFAEAVEDGASAKFKIITAESANQQLLRRRLSEDATPSLLPHFAIMS
jgi:hypothetical protein